LTIEYQPVNMSDKPMHITIQAKINPSIKYKPKLDPFVPFSIRIATQKSVTIEPNSTSVITLPIHLRFPEGTITIIKTRNAIEKLGLFGTKIEIQPNLQTINVVCYNSSRKAVTLFGNGYTFLITAAHSTPFTIKYTQKYKRDETIFNWRDLPVKNDSQQNKKITYAEVVASTLNKDSA